MKYAASLLGGYTLWTRELDFRWMGRVGIQLMRRSHIGCKAFEGRQNLEGYI